MLDTLRQRARSLATAQDNASPSSASPIPPPSRSKMGVQQPYEVAPRDGSCRLLDLPDEVLAKIFTRLDRASLTRCFRLCSNIHDLFSTNSSISLHHLLLCNSLLLNPHALTVSSNLRQIPPSSAHLLSTLRERVTRFRNFNPRQTTPIEFAEPEANLYEYLEGVLLRGVTRRNARLTRTLRPTEVAVYDIRKLSEWEDEPVDKGVNSRSGDGDENGARGGIVGNEDGEGEEIEKVEETTESEAGEALRTSKKFDFEVAEFAVDPGMDLLVLVEVRTSGRHRHTMHFHLLTLSAFSPHPRAAQAILEWPETLLHPEISLGFQICDDGLFVLRHNSRGGPYDQLCGWQWTTGRLAVVLKAFPTMSFESFVLLSPSAFVIPTIITHLDPLSDIHDELDDPSDLSWTHHLHVYAFPPFFAIKMPSPQSSEPMPPPHTAIHIATFDLPTFYVDIMEHIPPPRLNIRTDPPPRHTFPTHPDGSATPFAPHPESGLIVMEVYCQLPRLADPHYVICLLKSTLAQYLPAPTSPLLFQAFPRPAPVIPWATLAPHSRMFGPDCLPASWVCYVYQNRYISPQLDEDEEPSRLRLYDFDPLRVRKEICDRTYTDPPSPITSPRRRLFRNSSTNPHGPALDGERDGIYLVTAETVLPPQNALTSEVRTGGKLPYTYVERSSKADVALIDGERIIGVEHGIGPTGRELTTELDVMEF